MLPGDHMQPTRLHTHPHIYNTHPHKHADKKTTAENFKCSLTHSPVRLGRVRMPVQNSQLKLVRGCHHVECLLVEAALASVARRTEALANVGEHVDTVAAARYSDTTKTNPW